MGVLKSLAKRAIEKVVGPMEAPRTPPAAPPPSKVVQGVTAAREARSAPAAAPPAPPPAAPPAAEPAEARVKNPPVKPADLDPSPPSSIGEVARPRRRRAPTADEEAAAELLANIEAGAQEVRERMEAGEPVTLLDVREPFETAGGVVPGAILIPLGQLAARWRELEGANEVVCYCASGARSLQAAALLRGNGLFNATSMEGGISQWMALGGKVVRPGG